MKFFSNTRIKFLEMRKVSFIVSAILIVVAVFSIIRNGNDNLGIDFAGGILVQMKLSRDVPSVDIRNILMDEGMQGVSIQQVTGTNSIIFRLKGAEGEEGTHLRIKEILEAKLADIEIIIERNDKRSQIYKVR